MKFSILSIASVALLAGNAAAICPGFNYGVSNVYSLGNGVNRWDVYDANCNVVDGLTTNQNPCTSGTFSCSPAPITITGYTNTFSKLRYACRTDSRAGSCGGRAVAVCCRNDGN